MAITKWIYSGLLLFCVTFQALCQDKEVETRNLDPFYAVAVSDGIDVYLQKGNKTTVRVEVINGSLSDVITQVSGGSLDISMKAWKDEFKHNFNKTKVKAYITYVELKKMKVSSAASIFSSEIIKTPSLSVKVSSAGSIEMPVDVKQVFVDVSSAGDVTLEGKTNSFNVEASSAGDVDAFKLDSKNVTVRASSAASVSITAADKLEIKASSGATVHYWGNPPTTHTESSSGGRIQKKE